MQATVVAIDSCSRSYNSIFSRLGKGDMVGLGGRATVTLVLKDEIWSLLTLQTMKPVQTSTQQSCTNMTNAVQSTVCLVAFFAFYESQRGPVHHLSLPTYTTVSHWTPCFQKSSAFSQGCEQAPLALTYVHCACLSVFIALCSYSVLD